MLMPTNNINLTIKTILPMLNQGIARANSCGHADKLTASQWYEHVAKMIVTMPS